MGLKSKVFATYDFPDKFVEVKYGTFEPTIAEKFSVITKLVLPIILFFIGLGVILNKKISKKIKKDKVILSTSKLELFEEKDLQEKELPVRKTLIRK